MVFMVLRIASVWFTTLVCQEKMIIFNDILYVQCSETSTIRTPSVSVSLFT